jgi:hypothetical protein
MSAARRNPAAPSLGRAAMTRGDSRAPAASSRAGTFLEAS